MMSSTKTLVAAMRVLARDIQSDDGVANAAIAEAADRLAELDEMKARTTEAAPFAWATFDGEGSYDLRLYECNESYRDEWIAANGQNYADWVTPLYEAQESTSVVADDEIDRLQTRIAELERQAAIGRRAVEMLADIQTIQTDTFGQYECPSCFHGSDRFSKERHNPDCELAALLRDAEQAGMGVGL